MQTGDSTGAAILVQTIFLKDGHLKDFWGSRLRRARKRQWSF